MTGTASYNVRTLRDVWPQPNTLPNKVESVIQRSSIQTPAVTNGPKTLNLNTDLDVMNKANAFASTLPQTHTDTSGCGRVTITKVQHQTKHVSSLHISQQY
jgi:hypothetical protein